MIVLAFTVACRIINPVVDQPKLIPLGIDVDARYPPNALDHRLGMTAVLATHQFNGKRGILVQHGVIKNHLALRGRDHLATHILPDQAWRNLIPSHVTRDRIVAEMF